jgi:hypothetical protein
VDLTQPAPFVTFPNFPDPFTLATVSVNPLLFQPFVGYSWFGHDLYVQGFSALVIPFDDQFATVWSNDVAVGEFIYTNPNRFLSAVASALEFHTTTPLGKRGGFGGGNTVDQPVTLADLASFTGGFHFFFRNASSLDVGLNSPINGPRPYDLQLLARLNVRW